MNFFRVSRVVSPRVTLQVTCARQFSQTTSQKLRSSELHLEHFKSLRCNSDRLWSDIHETAKWGIGRKYGDHYTQTGLSRLTLSDSDKQARDWFIGTTKSLNCNVEVDEIGNIFAVRPGLSNDAPATFAGSHLDSQPAGGRFDGVLGVCAGIEMLRVLNDNWIETEGPVGVINWTNEEGARFPVSMMGSGVWADPSRLQDTYDLKEVGNGQKKLLDELRRIGYQGELPADHRKGVKVGGHFELHIEQGPKLEATNQDVGAVSGVQAYRWYQVEIQGRAAHSGATGMDHRADALRYAARMIHELTEALYAQGALITFGIIKAEPGSINTVPEKVSMTMDVRQKNDQLLEAALNHVQEYVANTSREQNAIQNSNKAPSFKISLNEIFSSPAVRFDEIAVECVKDSASNLLGLQKKDVPELLSGAGHDSVNTAKHCPTAMIFVPCREGVSHDPQEWCEQKHCAVGTDVLLQSVLRFDKWRHRQGHFEG